MSELREREPLRWTGFVVGSCRKRQRSHIVAIGSCPCVWRPVAPIGSTGSACQRHSPRC